MSNASTLLTHYGERYRQVARMRPRLKGPRAYVNWLRSGFELWAGTSRIGARPLKLTMDPTNVCQLRCPLCPTGLQVHDRESGHAQLHMLEKLLDEVGDYLFFIDFFNWGEPLLNTHLEDFINLANSRNVLSTISTNLSLQLSDDRIRRLVTSGLREMIVSLDGASSETYQVYRRRGKFDLVCENMRRIVDMKRRLGSSSPLVTWQFLVFGFNEHEVEKARILAAEIGVDRILFRPAFLDVDRYPLPPEEKEAMAGWRPKDALYQIQSSSEADSKPHSRCGWHYTSTAVNWDGTVAPCCTLFEKRHDFGSLDVSGSYMDVVNNEAFRSVRERFAGKRKQPVDLVCEHCPTPSIMNYNRFLNRQILLFTAVGLIESIRRLVGGSRGKKAPAGTLPVPTVSSSELDSSRAANGG
jgi:MoaA/NifB/PqqE/SkfB family radical SAM enzyme